MYVTEIEKEIEKVPDLYGDQFLVQLAGGRQSWKFVDKECPKMQQCKKNLNDNDLELINDVEMLNDLESCNTCP